MISYYKRTKIIATLGPAITQKIWDMKMLEDPKNKEMKALAYKKMEEIISGGVNCVRLNFSHGNHDEQIVRIKIAREVAKKLNRNLSIMLDTKGPEIRVGKLDKDLVTIKADSEVTIHTIKEVIGNEKQIFVTDSTGTYNMANDVKVGGLILVDDGKLQLRVEKVDASKGVIKTIALNEHIIGEKRRINLPGATYSLPFMSDKDRADIKFAVENNLDYIAGSFVNSAENIREMRNELRKHDPNSKIQIISKIESTHAINNIDEIIAETDGIMVARGDLGLEIPYYDVPYWEKYIIRVCRYIGKPVIVATQMLDSLEKNIQPTRAEVTDVFFAVERGTDATMLSGESAKGLFPTQAVGVMNKIDVKSELLFDYKRALNFYFPKAVLPFYAKRITKKIAKKLMPYGSDVAPDFPYEFVVLFNDDHNVIKAISNVRPAATIIVVTDKKELLTAYGINYAIQMHYVENLTQAIENYQTVAKEAIAVYKKEPTKAFAFVNKKIKSLSL